MLKGCEKDLERDLEEEIRIVENEWRKGVLVKEVIRWLVYTCLNNCPCLSFGNRWKGIIRYLRP